MDRLLLYIPLPLHLLSQQRVYDLMSFRLPFVYLFPLSFPYFYHYCGKAFAMVLIPSPALNAVSLGLEKKKSFKEYKDFV